MNGTTLDSSLRLAVPEQAAREIGDRSLRLASCSSGHLLFTVAGGPGTVCLAGVLGEVAVVDLLSFFNMFRKTGVLSFDLDGGRKEIFFQEGEVVSAASTFPEEDLGEILFELGKVDRPTLEKVRPFSGGRAPIGKVLVDKQAVSAKDLWLAVRHQVETIVYHLFGFDQGSYHFHSRSLAQEEIVRLSMSTQNLIMEGLRRVDERQLFMRHIPSLDACPVAAAEEVTSLTGVEAKVLEIVRRGGSKLRVREVVRQSGAGEFDGLRLLYRLVEKGAMAIPVPQSIELSGALGEIVRIGNGALTALYRRAAEKNPRFPEEVRRFLRDLPQPYSFLFRDATLQADGSLDGGRIAANLDGLEERDKEKLLAEGLNELIYMECLAVRRQLGAAESAELLQRVQEVSRRLMIVIGR